MPEHELKPDKLTFAASAPDAADTVRRAFLNRLRAESGWRSITLHNHGFETLVEIRNEKDKAEFRRVLAETYWALVVEGIIIPEGVGCSGPLGFHVTGCGQRVLTDPDYQPHDPANYLRELEQSITNPDATVLAYLGEALHCYAKGLFVASTMMLGIAAERVFLLVCESLLAALKDPGEQEAFQKLLDRNPMKPKLDWLTDKFRQIQTPKRPADLPEDVDITIPGVFNLIRCQRNDVGHPRPAPPTVARDDAYGYLRIFPSYYATAEKVREFLALNGV